jgi:hypothetical protein
MCVERNECRTGRRDCILPGRNREDAAMRLSEPEFVAAETPFNGGRMEEA